MRGELLLDDVVQREEDNKTGKVEKGGGGERSRERKIERRKTLMERDDEIGKIRGR